MKVDFMDAVCAKVLLLFVVVSFQDTCFAADVPKNPPPAKPRSEQLYDLVVYGDSSGAVIAAVAARREGRSVILVNPTSFLGGMSASGLGATDFLGKRAGFGGNAHGAPGSYFFPYPGDWPIPTTGQRAKWNVLPDGKPGEYLTDRLTDEAVKFIRDNRDRPFFLYFPHYGVHTPLQAKPEMIAKYEKVPEAERQGKPEYAAMIESLDESVGRVLATLKELGLEKNTVIIFTADNGGFYHATSNAPLRANKGAYYEGGIRVPLMIKWPGVTRPGWVSAEPVTSTDLYPTCLAAAKPDLVSELRRELDAWRKDVGAEMMRPNPDYDPAAELPKKGKKKAKQGAQE